MVTVEQTNPAGLSFAAVTADHGELAPLYRRTAAAVAASEPHGVEISPWLAGKRRRLRRLDRLERTEALRSAEKSGAALSRGLLKLVKGLCTFCYYGDAGVMRTLGYDADANARRGRELRAREGRP